MADVTASLQEAIDRFPDCFFADDMLDVANRFAKIYADTDEVQKANINELIMVGQSLMQEGGDGPNPSHAGISGLYCRQSDGYTRFLSAYAKVYRRSADLDEKRGSIWNPKYWSDAVTSTFEDIGNGVGKLGEGIGTGIGKIVIQLLPLIAVILVLGIVVLVVQKKVA